MTGQTAILEGEGERIARVRHGAALAGAALVALLVLEIALRLASIGPSIGGLDASAIFVEYPLTQEEGYVTLRKGFRGRLWGFPFRVNRHGFRSPPVPVEPPPDSLRVLLLGSCITLGGLDQTPDGFSAFSSSLQDELQQRFPNRTVEVLNAAVPGSFELQTRAYWKAELARFQPDIVVYESGASQVIEPGARLREYEARAPGATKPAVGLASSGLRARLYGFFNRSVVLSHFYAFRRGREDVFYKYFYRRPLSTPNDTGLADAYTEDVLEPSGDSFRRDLAELYRTFDQDGAAVVAYTFSHPLPDLPARELAESDLARLNAIELLLEVPDDLAVADLWTIFRRAYAQTSEINEQVAEEQGVAYFDLQRRMRSPRYYDGYYYYLSNTEGSQRKGELLAQYILNHYDASRGGFDSVAAGVPPKIARE